MYIQGWMPGNAQLKTAGLCHAGQYKTRSSKALRLRLEVFEEPPEDTVTRAVLGY